MSKKNESKMIAVAYYRYSSHNQSEQSIEGQRRDCEAYAERNGITIIKEYIDRAHSAKTDMRPEFQRMIDDSAEGTFNAVLVWKLDRFSRNRYDSAHYKARLRKNGVKLISAMENISDSPEGILIESLLEGMAEYYSAELAQKVQRGMRESALKCKLLGAPPFGYRKAADGGFEIYEPEANAVRLIYNMYNQGHSNKDIIDHLNKLGLKTRKGMPFNHNSIYTILQNVRYTGIYKYRDIEIPGGMPQIIPEDTYRLAQLKKNDNRTTLRRHPDCRRYPLAGKLYCGHCGSLMIGVSGYGVGGRKYYYYQCNTHKKDHAACPVKNIRAERLEEAVLNFLNTNLLTDEQIDTIADRLENVLQRQADDSLLPMLEQKREAAELALKNITDAIEAGIFTATTQSRLKELEAEISELKYAIIQESAKVPKISKSQFVFMLRTLRDKQANATYKDIMLDAFINRIYYTEDVIAIWLNYTDEPFDPNDPDKVSADAYIREFLAKEKEQPDTSTCSSVLGVGGADENRTRVRKQIHPSFSERRLRTKFPA